MGLGLLIGESDLEERLENSKLLFKRIGRGGSLDREGQTGRGNGTSNKASFIRELIAADAKEFGITKAAESWDVSLTSAFCYRDGRRAVSQQKNSDTEMVQNSEKIIEERRGRIIESTTLKLMEVMESLDTRSVKDPLKGSVIGKNLASIAEKMGGGGNINAGLTFVIHVPTVRKIEDFGEPIRVIEAEVLSKK